MTRAKETKPRRLKGEGAVIDGYIVHGIGGRKRAHVLLAEKALGHPLPPLAVVHHVNEQRDFNEHGNLVVCPDRAYHNLLHQRMRAFDESGHYDWLRCPYCKTYDAPENLHIKSRGRNRPGGLTWNHKACACAYAAARKHARTH
jgi:hypothetical protein